MQKVQPTKNQDGTETVTLWGTTVDVTGKDSFTLFKRDFKVIREKKAKKKATDSPATEEVAQEEPEPTS